MRVSQMNKLSLAVYICLLLLEEVSSWSNELNPALTARFVDTSTRSTEKVIVDPAMALHEALDRIDATRYCDIGQTKYGRGLVARKDMKPGEVVFRIPLSETICVEEPCEESPPSISDAWAGRLAQKLLERKKQINSETDTITIAGAYSNALPQPPPTPSRGDWSVETLQTLDSNDILQSIENSQTWRNQQWDLFGVSDGALGDQQRFLDALDLVSSRTIRCGSKFMLVPFLDMANYASRDQGGGYYTMSESSQGHKEIIELRIGDRGVKAGDEVFLDYGDRTNDEWLIYYGFLPDRNSAESVVLPCSRRSITWDDVKTNDKSLKDECADFLSRSQTTLGDDIDSLRNLEMDEENYDITLVLAMKYRIAQKTLLSAVAGAKTTSAFSSAFL